MLVTKVSKAILGLRQCFLQRREDAVPQRVHLSRLWLVQSRGWGASCTLLGLRLLTSAVVIDDVASEECVHVQVGVDAVRGLTLFALSANEDTAWNCVKQVKQLLLLLLNLLDFEKEQSLGLQISVVGDLKKRCHKNHQQNTLTTVHIVSHLTSVNLDT